MNRKAFSIIFGLLAVALGVAYTLAACGVIEPFTIFIPGWWTVFIIVPGLIMLFSSRSSKFVSLCLIALGVALFLHSNDLLGDIKKYIIPVLLIIFGLSLIIKVIVNSRKKKITSIRKYQADGDIPAYETAFGEINPDFYGKTFKGCSIDVAFGSGKLDLRNSIIDKEANIFVNSAFSGVRILLPPDCRLDIQTSTSFAGVNTKYVPSDDPDAPIVNIFVSSSFGGVDIL